MFVTEKQLVDCFKKKTSAFINDVLGTRNACPVVLEEYDCLFGVADLVLGVLKAKKKVRPRPGIKPDWVKFLTESRTGTAFTLESFAQYSGLRRGQALECLTAYCGAGFFRRQNKTTYRKVADYELLFKKVISVEAKLSHWKRALLQAYRYKPFSDYSFVLLDQSRSEACLRAIDQFRKYNVGLATISQDGITLHYVPQPNSLRAYCTYRLNETACDSMNKGPS